MVHCFTTTGKNQRGFAAFEVLVAMTLLVLSLSTVLVLVSGSQSASVSSQIHQGALSLAQQQLETARANARADFSSVVSQTPETTGPYTKSVTVTPSPDGFTKNITSLVRWNNNQVALSTLATDWSSVVGTCTADLSGTDNWKSPHVYFSDRLANYVTGSNPIGLAINDIRVVNKKLYVAARGASNTDYTFYIFSLPNDPTQAPVFDGALDNAPTVSTGLNAVAVFGNYAYVANGYAGSSKNCSVGPNCAQLQVIDVSIPISPIVVKHIKIPGITSGGNLSPAVSIFYSKGYVYVGLSKVGSTSTNGEFNIIDVGGGGGLASPANPILMGSYIVGNGVNAVVVRGNYAYVASPNSENMTMLDITDRANPYQVGGSDSLTAGGAHGKSLYLQSNTVYLGRTFGSNELYAFDVTNPSNVSVQGSRDVGSGNQTAINGLVAGNELAFDVTNNQFQVWNVADLATITPWSSDGTTNTFLNLQSVAANTAGSSVLRCTGNYIYLGLQISGSTKDYFAVIGQTP